MIAKTRTHESRAGHSVSPDEGRFRGVFKLSALIGLLALPLSVLGVDLEQKVDFHIPAQDLSTALIAFSKQARLQVIISDDLTGQTTRGVSGSQPIKQALSQLLEPAGLRYRVAGETSITVGKTVKTAETETHTTRAGYEKSSVMGFAQNDRTKDGQSSDGQSPNGTEGSENPQQTPSPDMGEDKGGGLEEIVVTGTHIRGAENLTVPLTVLDKTYIESTGFSTTAALLESLPQNFALANQSSLFVPGVTSDGSQGASINLRGIGEGTTLTLLNGRRMAPGFFASSSDISSLPLTAIERVEVLTDGASALYGSDAVGGVVNFILRDDFEGAETKLRIGQADGDVDEYRVSQALGGAWDSGNALLSLELYKRDLLLASERDFVPGDSLIGSLAPRDKNTSALFSGQQELTDTLRLFADILHMRRETYNQGGNTSFNLNKDMTNRQLVATAGLGKTLGGGWQIEASVSEAQNKLEGTHLDVGSDSRTRSKFTTRSLQLKADGSLFQLPSGAVRAALGADWRNERFQAREAGTFFSFNFDEKQIVRSVFSEILMPLLAPPAAAPGGQRVELSLAGRFDDYSSFGSSFDPQVGVMWEPLGGLRLRASYGTSYKAPNLPDYDEGLLNNGTAFYFNGIHLLALSGTDPASFKAQESQSLSIGLEFAPAAIRGLDLGLNYYSIEYTDRLAEPSGDAGILLSNPEQFPGLINQSPTVQDVLDAIALAERGIGGFFAFNEDGTDVDPDFDPATVQVITDMRRRNLSEVKTSGLDVSAQYRFTTGRGDVQLGLSGTHVLEREDRITENSPAIDRVDRIFNPPDWRVRALAAWDYHAWAASLFVNHADSYIDDRLGVPLSVASNTTVDTRLAYTFPSTTVSLNVQNLLDRHPPRIVSVSPGFDLGFDPTNADPMGRLIALELVHQW